MGAAVEGDGDLSLTDGDAVRHVDEVAEDLPSVGIAVAAHAAGEEAVQAAGDHQERQVESDLEPDGGGQRVDAEEADGVPRRGPPAPCSRSARPRGPWRP